MERGARRCIRAATLVTLSCLAAACGAIYVRGGGLASVGPPASAADRAARPTAALVPEGALQTAAARDLVRRVTEEDAAFRAFDIVSAEPPPDVADYRLTLDLTVRSAQPNKPTVGLFFLAFGHVLTLGLVPLPLWKDELVLTAVVRDRHGAVVEKYVLEDSITAYQQTLTMLLPLEVFASRDRAIRGATANMLRTVYRRMAADGLLGATH